MGESCGSSFQACQKQTKLRRCRQNGARGVHMASQRGPCAGSEMPPKPSQNLPNSPKLSQTSQTIPNPHKLSPSLPTLMCAQRRSHALRHCSDVRSKPLSGAVWEGLEGFGSRPNLKVWEGLEGSGGFGKVWEGLGGLGGLGFSPTYSLNHWPGGGEAGQEAGCEASREAGWEAGWEAGS